MGKVKKGVKCSVEGCDKPAARSVSRARLAEAGADLKVKASGPRVYLCEEHYKEFKRALRRLKRLEKWRWMA